MTSRTRYGIISCVSILCQHLLFDNCSMAHVVPYNATDPCSYWLARWIHLRNSSRTNGRFTEFVHIRKAAGHTVELWLSQAYQGPNGTHTTSLRNRFHGGHHPIGARRHEKHQVFVTVFREPVERIVSHFNDIHTFLSIPGTCGSLAAPRFQPSYCSGQYYRACVNGTGWNAAAMVRYNFSGNSPCIPRLSPVDYSTHAFVSHNEQFMFTMPHYSPHWNTSYLTEQVQEQLRTAYAVIGVATRESVAAFLERLRYVLDTPYDPHHGAPLSDPSPLRRDSLAPHQLPPLSNASKLTMSERASILAVHRLDGVIYPIAASIDLEQRRCFERLREDGGSTAHSARPANSASRAASAPPLRSVSSASATRDRLREGGGRLGGASARADGWHRGHGRPTLE